MKTAGIAGGGLILSSSLLNAFGGNSGKKINIALVGIGAEGKILLDSLLKLPGLNFVAVCDIWKQRCTYGFRRIFREMKQKPEQYEDYKDLIRNHAKDLDAVVIATPDFWHSPMTCDFLEAGVNVYCEKMMSDTIEGAKKMVRAARKSGKLLQIGHQRKSNPRYIYARETILRKRNLLGRIMACNGQWNRAVTKDLTWPKNQEIPEETLKKYGYKDMNQFCNWRWDKGLGGGAISDLGAHQIDVFAWFLGANPKSVFASGSKAYYKKDWSDNVMCIFEYDKSYQGVPVQVSYQVLTTTSSGGGYFESFMGENGTLKMSENPSLTKVFREKNIVHEFENWDENVKLEDSKTEWEGLVAQGVLAKDPIAKEVDDFRKKLLAERSNEIADVRETLPLSEYIFPINLEQTMEEVKDGKVNVVPKPIHMYHLENFLGAVRGENELTCDGEHAFAAEAIVFKAREASEKRQLLTYEDSDFVVD